MKQSLQLKLGHQLTMTPQLQQAIKLLQLSTLELQAEIQEALESNPMLEVNEDSTEATADTNTEQEANTTRSEDAPDTSASEDSTERDIDNSEQEIPNDLPTDSNWEDSFDTYTPVTRSADQDISGYEHAASPTGSG